MQVEVLIIGQGICGTMLSWYLKKEGKTFVVIDDGADNSSSKLAAGIISPVTGRRYARSWMIEVLMPFAKTAYAEIADNLTAPLIYNKSIIEFFTSVQMREAFAQRSMDDDTFLHPYPDQNDFNTYFNYDFGCGEISPSYMVHLSLLLQLWRKELEQDKLLRKQIFQSNDLRVSREGVRYEDIDARQVVFCDGIRSMNHPWFQMLPFSANKGEALLIECDELPTTHLFKKGLMLAPLPEKNLYWVGSNYQWQYENEEPSEKFLHQTSQLLKEWLKVPFKTVEHKAAVRPATLERRPFVGFHPHYPRIGILNGMGTKGASLAPFFAHQLVQHMVHELPVDGHADVRRFSRILGK